MIKFVMAFILGAVLFAPPAYADTDASPPAPVIAPAAASPAPSPAVGLVDVLAANPAIHNANLIFPGQVITIPGRDPYTVVKGDTLNAILGPQSAPAALPALPAPNDSANVPAPVSAPVRTSSVNWDAVARCESGDNWAINTGNGFHGGLQFTLSTWHSNGGSGMPENAGRDEQIRVAENVLHSQGGGAWPVCFKRGG